MKSGTLSCAADDKLRTQRRSATGEKRIPGELQASRRRPLPVEEKKTPTATQKSDAAPMRVKEETRITRARRADNAVRRYGRANECVDEVKYKVYSKMRGGR